MGVMVVKSNIIYVFITGLGKGIWNMEHCFVVLNIAINVITKMNISTI